MKWNNVLTVNSLHIFLRMLSLILLDWNDYLESMHSASKKKIFQFSLGAWKEYQLKNKIIKIGCFSSVYSKKVYIYIYIYIPWNKAKTTTDDKFHHCQSYRKKITERIKYIYLIGYDGLQLTMNFGGRKKKNSLHNTSTCTVSVKAT